MFRSFFTAVVFGTTLAATAASAEIELKFATDSGDRESPSGIALAAWANAVKEGSNGEIDVKIFYQNELGGQLEVFDLFVAGEVDAMISWPSTSYDKRIGILNTPYMVTSWEEALEAYKPGGWANGVLNTVFNDIGLKYFGAWPEGFSGVATRGAYTTDVAGAANKNRPGGVATMARPGHDGRIGPRGRRDNAARAQPRPVRSCRKGGPANARACRADRPILDDKADAGVRGEST